MAPVGDVGPTTGRGMSELDRAVLRHVEQRPASPLVLIPTSSHTVDFAAAQLCSLRTVGWQPAALVVCWDRDACSVLRDAHGAISNELKEARTAGERLSRELDGVQAQLDSVREDHDADGRKHASHKQELAEQHEKALKEEALKAENALSSCRNDLELLRRSSHATEDNLRKVKAERDAERATSIDLRKALDDALATLEEKRAVIDAASRLAELSLGAAAPPSTKKKAKRRKDSPIEPLERIIDEKKSDVAALARDVAALARTGGQAPEERDLAALLEGVDGGAAAASR